MERKLLRICITFILLCIGINVKAEIANGTCGDNLTWVLNDDGTLTISGSGEMDNWSSNDAPWYSNRSKIHKVVIDNSVTSIGDSAFWYCYGLTSVTIPNSVTSIGNNAFNGSLREVNVSCENENDFISYLQRMDRYDIFYYRINASLRLHNIIINGEKKTSIIIPNSVTSIEAAAFLNCASLTSIIIPNSVTTIGVSAFYGCSNMSSVVIGEKVEEIGDGSFIGCTKISEFTCKAWFTPIMVGGDCFTDETKNYAVLKVIEGREAAYKATIGWNDFVNIETIKPENTTSDYDINHDGQVNVGDLTEIVTAIMGGSSKHHKNMEVTDEKED